MRAPPLPPPPPTRTTACSCTPSASTTPSASSAHSIALGVVELALTPRDQSKAAWPADLPAQVDSLAAAYDAFAEELSASPALAAAASTAAKVKAVADAVWGKLVKGSYSKDLPHAQVGPRPRPGWAGRVGSGPCDVLWPSKAAAAATRFLPAHRRAAHPPTLQHVASFAAALAGLPGAKRQLDCAGVVTTTYSLCQALFQRHPERHADLAAVRMQVSEDHCFLQLDAGGARETSVEVRSRRPVVWEDCGCCWLLPLHSWHSTRPLTEPMPPQAPAGDHRHSGQARPASG